MLIERPFLPYRLLIPGAIWRIIPPRGKVVYLTFDDGPIPDVTPQVLDILDQYGARATFFMVGDNVSRYPELFAEVLKRGHSVGNHTMHHTQGLKTSTDAYLTDISQAARLIPSRLFRPPHGLLKPSQLRRLKSDYRIIMHDLVTRDYSASLSPDKVLANVCSYARNGSIIVFHDSLKARRNVLAVLPRALQWLKQQGYEFLELPMD